MPGPTEFYLTLPSNTKVTGNSTGVFRVNLADAIELEGAWQVGLVELQYSGAFETLTDSQMTIKTDWCDPEEDVPVEKEFTVTIPNGHYSTPQQIVDVLNLANRWFWNRWCVGVREMRLADNQTDSQTARLHAKQATYRDSIEFTYIKPLGRAQITTNLECVKHLEFDEKLQYTLGLKDKVITKEQTLGDYPMDVMSGLHTMMIYSSLVAPQRVGDTKTNLLKAVPLRGHIGEVVSVDFPNPHYVDLLLNRFSTVDISIKGSDGGDLKFMFGKVICKLHFKKKRLL